MKKLQKPAVADELAPTDECDARSPNRDSRMKDLFENLRQGKKIRIAVREEMKRNAR